MENLMTKTVKTLEEAGYDIRDGKILSATPKKVGNLSALGMTFRFNNYRAVRPKDALRLKTLVDPVTKQPYLKFAYYPLPASALIPEEERIEEIDVSLLLEKKAGIEPADISLPKKDGVDTSSLIDGEDDESGVESTEEVESDEEAEGVDGESASSLSENDGAEEEDSSDEPTSAEAIERKEYEAKTKVELQEIVEKDLGLVINKKETKAQLIDMILS